MLIHVLERSLLALNLCAAIDRISAFMTKLFTERVEQDHRSISIASAATLAAGPNSMVELGEYAYYLKLRCNII